MSVLSAVTPRPSHAVDTGIGKRAASIANIDPTSAVAGSTQIRSFPGQAADGGMIQLYRFEGTQAAASEAPVHSASGAYVISLSAPLSAGENLYVKNTGSAAASTGVIVQTSAAPLISGPLNAGDSLVVGYATPGRTVTIRDVISNTTLGTSATVSGSGSFSVVVPALRMFQAIRATDSGGASSNALTVLGFTAATHAGIPPPAPTPCPATVLQASAPSITRFECGLLNPRGVAVLADGALAILAGVPPAGLINYPPPATIKFDPATQTAELLAPITGVGVLFDSGTNSLFLVRPHLFRLQDEHMVERHDGEIVQMDPSTGTAVVVARLLDIAPTAIATDTSASDAFGGGAVISSVFFDYDVSPPSYPANPTEPSPSAIWSATLSEVAPLRINATPPLIRVQGLAVGDDWDNTPALFAAQPGSGTIFRILGSNGSYSAAPLLSGLGSPVELAFAPNGSPFGSDLYATDIDGGRILKITIGPALSSTVQTYASGLDRPFGLAFSSTGLFVTEYSGNIIAIYP